MDASFPWVREAATSGPHAARKKERGLDKRQGETGRGITRLHKRSAEGGDTSGEGAALVLERRGAP
jgi:hypothetical protein